MRDDLCSGTLGFSHNLGWEMGIGTSLQDPLFNIRIVSVCVKGPFHMHARRILRC